MAPYLAAALGNAQQRARLGWPLMVLTIAFYAPADTGLARLALVVTGLVFLARRIPGSNTRASQSSAPTSTLTTRATTTTNTQPAKTPAKATRPRGSNGRFQK